MKFAYGSIKKINEAIEAGTIPAETLIITSDSADVAELFFYDKNKLLKKVERKNKFKHINYVAMYRMGSKEQRHGGTLHDCR